MLIGGVCMKLYILLALLEYFLLFLITSIINVFNYEYLHLKYSTFEFSNENSENGLNILIKMFFPTIYLILVSGFLYNLNLIELNSNIYLINIFYYFINYVTLIVFLGRVELIDKKSEIKTSIFSIALSIFMYYIFINKTTNIFIDIDELKNGVWLAIITFFYSIFTKKIYYNSTIDSCSHNKNTIKYIDKKYQKFVQKYDNFINCHDTCIKNIIYSIMIFENYNRPWIIRKMEYIKLLLFKSSTLGIMQVYSTKIISDEESVIIAVNIIENYYNSLPKKLEKNKKIEKTIYKYNHSDNYVKEVKYIYDLLSTLK